MKDETTATGQLKITLRNAVGDVKEQRTVKNLVVNIGKEFIASRMSSSTMSPISHMSVGTNMVSPMATDTVLGAELSRVSLTSATTVSRTLTFVATFPPGSGTGPLTEAGLFNAASGGTMLARTTFGVFTKEPADALDIEWDVTIN